MWWEWLISAVLWVVGAFLYSFGPTQILLVLTCAIPLTKRFSRHIKPSNPAAIYKSCAFTIVLWTIVTAGVIALVCVFATMIMKICFFVGFGFAALLSIGKLSRFRQDNFEDYFRAYGRYYNQQALSELAEDPDALFAIMYERR